MNRKMLTCSLAMLLMLTSMGCANQGPIVKLDPTRLPRVTPPAEVAHNQDPRHVKVLVLEFNPEIPAEVHAPGDPAAGPTTVRELGGWNDPLELAAGYMQDICDASGGYLQFEIVEWLVVREFQKKVDGFTYTPQQYVDCLRKKTPWHDADGVDYPAAIARYDIIPRVESGKIDEVWWFGAPYFGYWESAMAGQGAFYINGGVYGEVPSRVPFAIMGFNYERGVAEMLHDLCHRTESTMTRIYGGWKCDELTSNWARFAANAHQSNGVAAVGTCHYPPNGVKDYDYANPRAVQSSADAWLSYPDVGSEMQEVTCETWGGPDYHRAYMRWWFGHLPKAPGVNADGRLNNWWTYVFDFGRFDERGKPASTKP
ncbi:MAG: hypothetical protein KKB50_08180 [Planctomycetes bacterium]|nr:hypothetical protein [Planctomycetota bacterium]